jgi:hypothetical protein
MASMSILMFTKSGPASPNRVRPLSPETPVCYVDMRHKLTRRERLEFLKQDLTYTSNQLDRDVVAESQIRTVLQQFRDRVLPDAFPGRQEVPKTLIFAKDDSHADDIVRIAREVFAEGNEFCQKITYRTGFTKITRTVKNEDDSESETTEWVRTAKLNPDEILANFRNSFYPRIAVTVDMISTGSRKAAIANYIGYQDRCEFSRLANRAYPLRLKANVVRQAASAFHSFADVRNGGAFALWPGRIATVAPIQRNTWTRFTLH